MIRHDGIGADLDGKNSGEMPKPVDYPGFAVREVAVRERVVSIQECPADTPAEAVIHSFLTVFDIFAARQSHGSPPQTCLTANSWKVPKKYYKLMGVQNPTNGCPKSVQNPEIRQKIFFEKSKIYSLAVKIAAGS
jgi:hypothetical protein